jgi:adenylyl-sulfate kinase
LRLYEHSIEESIRSFFSTCGLSFVHLKYEKLIRRPEQSIDKLNGYLGTDLTVRDLSSVYRGPLHQTPRNSPVDYAKAVLIYVKNYSERIDIDRRRVAPANHPEVRPIPQVAVPGDRPITEEIENPATSRINAAGGKPAIETANEGFTLWLTGLSGAGKSTISNLLAERLRAQRRKVEILDGDVVRTRLSKGLGFTKDDRDENIRRIGFVCDLLARNGVIAIAAAISPYRCLRDEIRARVKNFIEVYVNCPIDVLAARDVKGLYQRALAGTLANFTGVSDPYEPPVAPEVEVNSSIQTPEESVDQIWAVLQKRCLI